MQTLYAISRMALLISLYLLAGTASADRLNQTIATLEKGEAAFGIFSGCLLYTSPSPRDVEESRMPSSA